MAPCGDVGAALAEPSAVCCWELSGSPFTLALFHAAGWRLRRGAGRGSSSVKGFLVHPELLRGALLALLALWVWCGSVAAPLRSGFLEENLQQGHAEELGLALGWQWHSLQPWQTLFLPAPSSGTFEPEAPLLAVFVQVETMVTFNISSGCACAFHQPSVLHRERASPVPLSPGLRAGITLRSPLELSLPKAGEDGFGKPCGSVWEG